MSEHEPSENWDLEDLLKQIPVTQPSRELDRRVARLFHASAWRWIGPLSGLAAGVAITSAVFLHRPRPAGNPHVPASVVQNASDPPPQPAYIIEDRQVRSLGDAEIDGLQVRLEQSQSRIVVWQRTENGGLVRAEIAMPEKTTVRAVQRF
jgi:hypothetical protein